MSDLGSLSTFAKDTGMRQGALNVFLDKIALPNNAHERQNKLERELDLQKINVYLLNLLTGKRTTDSKFYRDELNILVKFRNHELSDQKDLPLFQMRQAISRAAVGEAQSAEINDVLLEEVSCGETTERLVTARSFTLGSAALGVEYSKLGSMSGKFQLVANKLAPTRPPLPLSNDFINGGPKAYLGTFFINHTGKAELRWGIKPLAFLQLAKDFNSNRGDGSTDAQIRRYADGLREIIE